MTKKTITSIEQKTITFYNDELIAIRADDAQIYVSVRHLCEALGIKRPQRQTDRIKRDVVMRDGLSRVPIMGTKQRYQAYMLRVDLVPLWLTGIDVSRVSEEIQPKIIQYKREATKVLWEAFQSGRLTADPTFDELLKGNSPAAQAVLMAQAVLKIAQQQLLLESRLDSQDQRLETIEAQLANPDRLITNSQAERISQAVKAVAMELGRRSGKNEHGGVYGEVYRTFSITSYKELPASRYDDCIKMLTDWYESLTDNVVF